MKFIGVLINCNQAGLLTSHPHSTPRACKTELLRRKSETPYMAAGIEIYAVNEYGISYLVERKMFTR